MNNLNQLLEDLELTIQETQTGTAQPLSHPHLYQQQQPPSPRYAQSTFVHQQPPSAGGDYVSPDPSPKHRPASTFVPPPRRITSTNDPDKKGALELQPGSPPSSYSSANMSRTYSVGSYPSTTYRSPHTQPQMLYGDYPYPQPQMQPQIYEPNLYQMFSQPGPPQAAVPQQRGGGFYQPPPRHYVSRPNIREEPGPLDEDEVRVLQRNLETAKMEIERLRYINEKQAAQSVINVPTQSTSTKNPSVASSDSASYNAPSFPASSRTGPTAPKSAYAWTGQASIRSYGKISNAVIDEACNMDIEDVPVDVVKRIAKSIEDLPLQARMKEAYDAVNATLYVCNFEDPEVVRRGLQVLDLLYKNSGVILWAQVTLSLRFFVHFIEKRPHILPAEKENLKFLCGMFAGWYMMTPTKEDLLAAELASDPTFLTKQFFEALVVAHYEFPRDAFDKIPPDTMYAVWNSLLRKRTFKFKSVKQSKQ
ncbi:hypothetical protein HDU83_005032 [Entophlyctis luteolus]|nr:hypothetical protein HDU82_002223 [Entophlyctis luteolus]KAJ3354581.1 hypothetical protein HDU83_005032 [Entophlyctis luteolus]KAJ3383541.1 hypothetical protein HDU84_003556 [Entophlyctis sp. JEL0112]